MKVLITGGNGFLGSNIAKACLQQGHEVTIISRNNTNIQDILKSVSYLQYSESMSYAEHLNKIVEISPNVIIHCAWDGGNSYSSVNSLSQFNINIKDGIQLLEIANKLTMKPHFIGFGSFTEYGIINKKASEIDDLNPITMYGLSKKIFKEISKLFCEQNDINWSWIRPCYIYGTNDVDTRLIPATIRKLVGNQVIELDSCDKKIDYLHIRDFCKAILCILNSHSTGIFNVCSGNEYNVKDIIDTISANINHTSAIVYTNNNNRTYTSKYICGDNSKLKNLGWYPEIDIIDGLKLTIEEITFKYGLF
jgi:nucleoside-diphosphate-sugar epimerase